MILKRRKKKKGKLRVIVLSFILAWGFLASWICYFNWKWRFWFFGMAVWGRVNKKLSSLPLLNAEITNRTPPKLSKRWEVVKRFPNDSVSGWDRTSRSALSPCYWIFSELHNTGNKMLANELPIHLACKNSSNILLVRVLEGVGWPKMSATSSVWWAVIRRSLNSRFLPSVVYPEPHTEQAVELEPRTCGFLFVSLILWEFVRIHQRCIFRWHNCSFFLHDFRWQPQANCSCVTSGF